MKLYSESCEVVVSDRKSNGGDLEELEEDFGEVMAILREGPLAAPTEKPSEKVWTAIAVSVGGDIAAAATVLEEQTAEDAAYPGPSGLVRDDDNSNVVSIDSRGRIGKRFAVVTAIAAALLLVALPLGLAFRGGTPDQRAELLALGGFEGAGQAELDGRTLQVDLEGLEAPDGSFYELWLLDLEGGQLNDLRSLGRVDANGSFTVPEDVDLDEFSVVDVSIEPDDGNPDHSGASVLQGELKTT